MMPISIITLVPEAPRADWFDACVYSVSAALDRVPDKYERRHVLHHCTDFYEDRKANYKTRGLIGMVDSDDLIRPEAVSACIEAMKQSGAGVAFTYQREFYEDGSEAVSNVRINARDVCARANSVHHFCLINSSLVPPYLFDLIDALGAGITVDWIVKAYVALRHGAVQVPIIGYDWRQHEHQHSRRMSKQHVIETAKARGLIKTWAPHDQRLFEPFPQWVQ